MDIKRVSNTYVPKTYPELQSFFENENTYECYVVKINTQVEKDNGYFSDGTSYHLIIIVKDNGSWKVGTICGCPIELLDADASVYAARSIGCGLITYISKPSYIDVMDENGTVHKNESFTEFVVNATCNEIGNEGYSDDALKANVMAIKMCGWWAIAGDYREAYGCDIKNGDVEYRSTLRTTTANTKIVRAAVTEMDGYCMVSSSGTGGKLFFASFIAGSSNADGAGSGRLRQNGSEYLASKKNYTWGQILHYYYDNSSYNNPSVGIVQFKYAS